jgi:hypothetical protein
MRILSFEIQDADGWTLEPMKLDAFNLLVGVSGAGKTRIVRAIGRVRDLALGTMETEWDFPALGGASFALECEHEGQRYLWKAELESSKGLPDMIRTERIEQGGQLIVERTPERFVFKGQPLPRLDRAKSAIATLKEDPAMMPLYVAFTRCVFKALNVMPIWVHALEKNGPTYESVEVLGGEFSQPLMHKALMLQEQFPASFADIEEAFREAFPLVTRLEAKREIELSGDGTYVAYPNLTAHESGVPKPVPFARMSSGMQRYLSFLIHLSFAPRGTVVLIDELESSFGINCLPAATDFLLRRSPDLQLILTSHHPYIIEQIPPSHWKIVTRKGSRVRVLDASAIPALEESRSHLDRFTRLINLPEYRRGIQAA